MIRSQSKRHAEAARACRERLNWSQSQLLRSLPRELRDMIYEYILPRDRCFRRFLKVRKLKARLQSSGNSDQDIDPTTETLFQVCRAIRSESIQIYYHKNTFTLDISQHNRALTVRWLKDLDPDAVRNLRQLNFIANANCGRCWRRKPDLPGTPVRLAVLDLAKPEHPLEFADWECKKCHCGRQQALETVTEFAKDFEHGVTGVRVEKLVKLSEKLSRALDVHLVLRHLRLIENLACIIIFLGVVIGLVVPISMNMAAWDAAANAAAKKLDPMFKWLEWVGKTLTPGGMEGSL